jgi:hypothetical protein
MVAPWSAFWDHNRFAEARPGIEVVVNSPYVRGAVSGIGVITALAGLAEIAALVTGRRRHAGSGPAEP